MNLKCELEVPLIYLHTLNLRTTDFESHGNSYMVSAAVRRHSNVTGSDLLFRAVTTIIWAPPSGRLAGPGGGCVKPSGSPISPFYPRKYTYMSQQAGVFQLLREEICHHLGPCPWCTCFQMEIVGTSCFINIPI